MYFPFDGNDTKYVVKKKETKSRLILVKCKLMKYKYWYFVYFFQKGALSHVRWHGSYLILEKMTDKEHCSITNRSDTNNRDRMTMANQRSVRFDQVEDTEDKERKDNE